MVIFFFAFISISFKFLIGKSFFYWYVYCDITIIKSWFSSVQYFFFGIYEIILRSEKRKLSELWYINEQKIIPSCVQNWIRPNFWFPNQNFFFLNLWWDNFKDLKRDLNTNISWYIAWISLKLWILGWETKGQETTSISAWEIDVSFFCLPTRYS